MKRLHRARASRGFTLLEVIVSLGILAIALLAIGDINGGAVRMEAYSKSLSIAVQLARGKLLDIEHKMHKDGLSDFSKEYDGDFSDEGWPDYTWKALIIKPNFEVNPDQVTQFISAQMGLPTGDQSSVSGDSPAPLPQGMSNPLAAGGALSGVIDTQIQAMSETIKQSVREVKLTVYWKVGGETESFDVVQDMIILANSTGSTTTSGLTPGAMTPNIQQQLNRIAPGLSGRLNGFSPQMRLP